MGCSNPLKYFEISSGKFPRDEIKLFETDVDEGWNNFEIILFRHVTTALVRLFSLSLWGTANRNNKYNLQGVVRCRFSNHRCRTICIVQLRSMLACMLDRCFTSYASSLRGTIIWQRSTRHAAGESIYYQPGASLRYSAYAQMRYHSVSSCRQEGTNREGRVQPQLARSCRAQAKIAQSTILLVYMHRLANMKTKQIF